MRWRGTAIVAVISFFSASILCAQTGKAGTLQDRVRAGKILSEETQARGYWVDPTTGLMWAAKDNGKDLRWKQAVKYCRNLRLNGHTDWRLPGLQELEAIADPSAVSPGLAGHDKTRPFFWKVKGGLFVTGDEWSSTPVMGDRGKPLFAWYFDFINLRAGDDDGNMGFWDSYDKRALCVRQS